MVTGAVGLFTACVISIILYFAAVPILSAFTDDAAVINVGQSIILIFALIQLPKGANVVYSGNLRGSADLNWLSKDHWVGLSGVKVKPNSFHEGVDHEVTIEQIGKSLNILGAFGADYNQQIRLEVHGQCSKLPIMKSIMDIADHPNVAVCWNSNDEDLEGEGLEYNFNLVKNRFGDTAHVRELNVGDYPYQELMNLFVKKDYKGWILLEARTAPADRVAAMKEQLDIFNKMVKNGQEKV